MRVIYGRVIKYARPGKNKKVDNVCNENGNVIIMPGTFRFLIVGLLVVLALVMTACVSQVPPASMVSPAPALTTVKVAYLPVVSNGPLFLAKEEGYFEQQGINVEFEKFQSAAAALPALLNGDIAVSGGGLSPSLINAISKGVHVRIVADKGRNSPGACNASGLVVRRELFENGTITKTADLKGKKIMAGNDAAYRVSRILQMGNLSKNDIESVTMDFASGVVALRNGAIDGADLTEPYLSQVLDDKTAVMFIPTSVCTPDYATPLFYGPAILDKDPELGRRFMVAYLQGVRQYNLGKTERNVEILSNYTNLDHDLLQRSCWLPIDPSGDLPRKPVRDYMDWMYANNQTTQNLDDNHVFDMSYVAYANGVLQNTTNNR
jgi:NitT/TauT family transport system substrate-binding protein